MTDPYEILGVASDANEAEIKRAFRQLAKVLHPDANPQDPEAALRFQAAVEAQDLLLDPDRRRQLDQQRVIAPRVQATRKRSRKGSERAAHGPAEARGSDGQVGRRSSDGPTVGERVGSFVGKAWRKVRGKHGKDIEEQVEVDLEEVATGIDIEHEMPVFVPCARCAGTGERRDRPCNACEGVGYDSHLEPMRITIPAGVVDGQRIRYRGRGLPESAEAAGDLYIVVSVRDHPLLRREGRDVHCRVPVRFDDAAQGAEIEVPTAYGKVRIPLPAGTPSGKTLRLREHGLPSIGEKGRGDQLVEVVVEVPGTLDPRQRELLDAFYAAAAAGQFPEREAFLQALDALYA